MRDEHSHLLAFLKLSQLSRVCHPSFSVYLLHAVPFSVHSVPELLPMHLIDASLEQAYRKLHDIKYSKLPIKDASTYMRATFLFGSSQTALRTDLSCLDVSFHCTIAAENVCSFSQFYTFSQRRDLTVKLERVVHV